MFSFWIMILTIATVGSMITSMVLTASGNPEVKYITHQKKDSNQDLRDLLLEALKQRFKGAWICIISLSLISLTRGLFLYFFSNPPVGTIGFFFGMSILNILLAVWLLVPYYIARKRIQT